MSEERPWEFPLASGNTSQPPAEAFWDVSVVAKFELSYDQTLATTANYSVTAESTACAFSTREIEAGYPVT